jgi:quinolinate synthase
MPALVEVWYENLSRFAEDLYPGRYTSGYVKELAELSQEVEALVRQKQSRVVAHNYQYPELQEVAEHVGDSLALSRYLAKHPAPRVDFCGVLFMGETAKTILGDDSRVFMPDLPGCSLVASIHPEILDRWTAQNPDGLIISYINTDALTKARSHYVCTSRNAVQVVEHAARAYSGRRILFLPDKYLGAVVLAQAQVDKTLVDLYDGVCHVHARIGEKALDQAMDRYPDAELLIHPECGCASSCMARTIRGDWPHRQAYFLSTDQMLVHARRSPAQKFLVATEKGMVYRLRKEVPEKSFLPVSDEAVCEYMKMNTLEKLRDSLQNNHYEVRLAPEIREKALLAIQRMLSIQ